ncbi:MAG TPA: zf-HC2 domain-containing protein [Acidimicrobiales bacterium]|nr:zf-HC2 domain-containing protein [Acidimicrobiales bacterium]
MNCDEALEAISAAIDGELIDDDGALRGALDEHLESCAECRGFQSYTVELRARLRFEAVDATPDVAPAVVAVLERAAAEAAASAGSSGSSGSSETSAGSSPGKKGRGEGQGATVIALPFWRRARTALRPSGPSRPGGRSSSDAGAPGRPLFAAVAAALVVGMIVGAAFVGVGQDTTPTAWAEDLPQQVVEAQYDITSLDADIVVVEEGRPDHDGARRFTGRLAYQSPERMALELTEAPWSRSGDSNDSDSNESGSNETDSDEPAADATPTAGAWAPLLPGEGDVHLLVRDDRWWLETVRSCTVLPGQTSCPAGGSSWTREVTGREAFSDAAPIPLELIGAVDSFTLAAAPPVLGQRSIAGRDAIGVRVSAAQVAHFLRALSPGDDLRSVYPSDPVDVWLDRDDLVPLAVDVHAGPSNERASWATAHDYREQPGDTVLSFLVESVMVNRGVPDGAFDWPDDADGVTVPEDEVVTPTTGPTNVLTEAGGPGSDDGLGDEGAGAAGAEPASGGAGLPPSTTTTTARRAPADGGDRPGSGRALPPADPGVAGAPADPADPAGADLATTTTTPTTSTTSTTWPSDPVPPRTTTTRPPTTTTAPVLVTTTTTGPADDGTSGDDGVVGGEDGAPGGSDADGDGDGDGNGTSGDDGVAGGADATPGGDRDAPDHRTVRDDGFRPGEAELVPEPSRLPDGMAPHLSGTIRSGDGPLIGVRSWTDGRAWVKVRATDGWDGPRLFGELGAAVRAVDLGDGGQGYVSADGRKIALHTDGLDVVVCGSLPTEQLRDIAGSLGVTGQPVPALWPESATATLDQARSAQPGLLVPHGLEGFGPPAVGLTGGAVSQLYAGPGDRAFTLTRNPTSVLAPPADDSFGVEVRGIDGRYSVGRGELEWTEDGASYSLQSPTVALSELLDIAGTLAPTPDVP